MRPVEHTLKGLIGAFGGCGGGEGDEFVLASMLMCAASRAGISLHEPAFVRGMVVWPTNRTLLPRTPFTRPPTDPKSPKRSLTFAPGDAGTLRSTL